jgi:hypothetical protein
MGLLTAVVVCSVTHVTGIVDNNEGADDDHNMNNIYEGNVSLKTNPASIYQLTYSDSQNLLM